MNYFTLLTCLYICNSTNVYMYTTLTIHQKQDIIASINIRFMFVIELVRLCVIWLIQIDELIVSVQECMHRSDDSNQMRCVSVSG